ncbi:response regulator [Phenylobacterium sp.]|uniref:response regulator transcription factor n=1 Tax=Phenylobacterium sp. TaxID=1871053 RepID=UPI0025D111E3|nr:response regulator transcription factor [Phenylobacterium sp.]MBX3482936.1 response regulator transcription factor [Phenylobacterium sp.]MCW5760488.1 response regulator transcription factor [Phenylobacterium sp.]
MSASLLLVDDHPLFREGFAAMVGKARPDWSLAMADSAAGGCAALAAGAFDLVIVDIQLPDRDGFAALAEMAALRPDVARVMISGREDMAARQRARHAGAAGFIDKAAEPARIVEMLQAVLDGGHAFDTPARGTAPSLSPRQAQVLELLAQGCANKEMRYRMGIAERTIRAHLTEVFGLLGVTNRVQAIVRARELGLIG